MVILYRKTDFKQGLKISELQIENRLRFGIVNSIDTHLRLKIPSTSHNFLNPLLISIEFTKQNL